jgi:HSP20 family molecular chaperone IbpA
MLFPREGLLSHFGQSFDDTIRPSLPTIAEPAWFAPPIDVQQDDEALTIVFQVTGHKKSELRVEASGRNLYVWGPRLRRRDQEDPGPRAMRVFAVPFDVAPHDLHTSREGDLLRVRIAKKADQVFSDPTGLTPTMP